MFSDTSRAQRPGEVNGQEYFFVERSYMEDKIEKGSFIEYGEYKGNLYGTSFESVRMLVNGGFVTILNPHYQALKMLRTPQLKPYIIYIKPPTLEELKNTRNAAHARSTFDVNSSRGFTVSVDLLSVDSFHKYKNELWLVNSSLWLLLLEVHI